MSAQHTPGPWTYEVVGIGGKHDNPRDVCEVTNGHCCVAEYVWAEDARLIAAAPELLEALSTLERYLRETPHHNAPAAAAARAAIAKATGSPQ